jgi:transcriptional regulator with XRE-family HTH domain
MLFGGELMEVKEVLSKRLKWLREQNRLAQKEIAAEIGITLNGYQKIEYGDREPKLDMLVELCDFYNVSSDFLLGRNDENEKLKKLSFKISNLRFSFTGRRKESEELNYKLEEMKNEKINYLSQLERVTDELKKDVDDSKRLADLAVIKEYFEKELIINEEKIADISTEVQKKYREIFSLQKQLSDLLFEYIEILLGIPLSNPQEDDILKEISPFRFEIDYVVLGDQKGYTITIFSKEVGEIGIYTKETQEEAVQLKEELYQKLKGIKH